MADKLRATQQLEALQARHVGTGHADTTKFEWQSNVARDQYSNFVGHPATLQYMSIGVGMPRALMRNQQIDKMIQPMQPPKPAAQRPQG